MSRALPLFPVFAPLAVALLLACTAAQDGQAQAPLSSTDAAIPTDATSVPPVADNDEDVDDFEDEKDLDLTLDKDGNYDPAAHIRAQLAKRPAVKGSGGPPQACMLSGTIVLAGMREDVRDCMQSSGAYSVAEFKRACEGLATALTGTGNAPARIQYLARCPIPAQGSCRNFMNTGMDAFYYQRTELASIPASCSNTGGHWQAGG